MLESILNSKQKMVNINHHQLVQFKQILKLNLSQRHHQEQIHSDLKAVHLLVMVNGNANYLKMDLRLLEEIKLLRKQAGKTQHLS